MQKFNERGCENPAREVTQKGFRQHFVKAIIEDDLPYSFGEKPGIQKCFLYILPKGYPILKHQTVRRDLDLLYSEMNVRISLMLLVSSHETD